jgi:hypothetical protein
VLPVGDKFFAHRPSMWDFCPDVAALRRFTGRQGSLLAMPIRDPVASFTTEITGRNGIFDKIRKTNVFLMDSRQSCQYALPPLWVSRPNDL